MTPVITKTLHNKSNNKIHNFSLLEPTHPSLQFSAQPWAEAMAQLLIESACDVLFHVVGGRLDWISSSIETLLGWHPEELHRQSLDELAHPSDLPPLRSLLHAATTGQRAEAEARLKHRDGHWRWTHIALAPRKRQADDPEAIGWMRDIQEQVEHRQQQEAANRSLAESEARYRLIAEHVDDVVFQADPSGLPTWFSSSLTALTGWLPQELIGQDLGPLLHPDHRQRLRLALNGLPADGHQGFEAKVRSKNGDHTWFAISIRQLPDAAGLPFGMVGRWRDIQNEVSTRAILARTRRARLEADDLLRKAEEHAAIGMGLISADGEHFVQANPALCKLLDCDESTLLGSSWTSITHPDDRNADFGRLDDIRTKLISSYRQVKRLIKANGETIWGDISISSIRNEEDDSLRLFIAQVVDITEQKEASLKILENQTLLSRILGHIDAHIYMKNRDGQYLYANRGVEEIMGLPAREILGKTDTELLPAEVASAIIAFDQDVFRCDKPIRREMEIITATGEKRIFLSEKMLLTSQGQDDCLIGYSTDITALKRAEQALRESEQHFRLLAENSSDVVLLLAEDGLVSWVSPSLSSALGWQPEDWTGRLGTDFLCHQGQAAHYGRNQERIRRGQAIVAREQILAKDGQAHWIETHASPYRDEQGQICGIVASFRVIDQEVAAEKALRRSEERHRLLAENALDVIWTMELDGGISFISPAVEKLRGFTAAEALLQPLEQTETPESAALSRNYIQRLQAAVAAGQTPEKFQAELEYYCKDGSTTWCEVLAIPLLDERGQFVQLLGMSRNIQEHKIHELELKQAHDQAQAVRLALLESNEALSAANTKLQKLATTDSLTGTLNRRTFEARLDEEIARSRRYGSELTLLMFDLDHFKAINDNHGHQVGDTVLVEICQRIRRQLRRTDCLARWGGEEFMVLMPHCPETKGQTVAEKLRHQIACQPIGPLRTVSASIGIAQLLEGEDREHLLQRLDQALYQAKALGRNNVAQAQATVNSSSH